MRVRANLVVGLTVLAGVILTAPHMLAQDTAPPATPPATPDTTIAVDLQLVLAVDISASIDVEEAQLQRDGYIGALVDPYVIRAIEKGPHGRIALAYLEWAGPLNQELVVDWQVIDGPDSARAFADLLGAAPLRTGRRTAISSAILHAIPLFRKGGFRPTRKVIDISGDGPNNGGFHVHSVRFQALHNGITINGLPILNDRPSPLGVPSTPDLDLYYEDCVIIGPDAFIVAADRLESFAAAVRRKLILEIAGITPPPRPRPRQHARRAGIIPAQAGYGLTDCTIGEKQYEILRRRSNP